MALDKGDPIFEMLLIEARYVRAVMRKHRMREWSNYSKWATEAVFEHVRRKDHPGCYSRMGSCFYYDNEDECRKLYQQDYVEPGDADETVGMYEIEVEDPAPQRYDMGVYDEALAAIEDRHDVAAARECARRYFGRTGPRKGMEELLSDKRATVVRRITL
ncbi:MAG: hypothetical protein MUE63_15760 [Xanthomonadales bacterium]|nr:hypothetical protein [Xanthomonadales bacterium]